MTESQYQAKLIKKIKKLFPGCMVIKTDPGYLQGIPDLLVLWNSCWALLEVKASENSPEQPNQGYYIDLLAKMSFSARIYPENEQEVLSALQQAFEPPRRARIS